MKNSKKKKMISKNQKKKYNKKLKIKIKTIIINYNHNPPKSTDILLTVNPKIIIILNKVTKPNKIN